METIITLSGTEKAGSLARLVVFLTRKGYNVKGQKITELPSGGRLPLPQGVVVRQSAQDARCAAPCASSCAREVRQGRGNRHADHAAREPVLRRGGSDQLL